MFSYLQSLSPRSAYKTLENGDKIHLVDVREPVEFSTGHARGSISLPLAKLTAKRIRKHLGDAAGVSEPLYVMCATGTRAEHAVRRLHNIGLKNAVLVNGGVEAWSNEQLPMDCNGDRLSFEQQTQVLVGVLLVVVLAKALLLHPAFYALIGIVGIAMIFAGMSRNNAISLLVARLPWNRATSQTVQPS